MKKIMMFVAAFLLLMSAAVFGQTMTGLPSNNALVKAGSGDITVKADSVGVTVEIPFSQAGVPVLYRSYARANGDKWQEVTNGKLEVATKVSAGAAIANLAFQPGIYRIRMWGKVGNGWLEINPASIFCRLDSKNGLGYEFIADTRTGEVAPVPKNYPAWN